jgi:exopolysaccharide production protein ExoZ
MYFTNLQVLRILGASVVVLCHLNFHSGRSLGIHSPALGWIFDYLAGLTLNVFFSMSGFVLVHSLETISSRQFICARLLRIFPAFWAALFVVVLLQGPPGIYWFNDRHVWAGLLLIPAGREHVAYRLGIEWTLVFELFFYAALGLAIAINKRRGPTIGAALWLVILVAARFLRPAGQLDNLPDWTEIGFSPFMAPILLGALATHLKPYGRIVRLVAPVAAPSIIFASRLITRWDVATMVAGVGSALLVVWAATARQIAKDHPLVTFGGWSYGVYLLHVPVITAVLEFGVRHGWGGAGMDLVAVAGMAALVVGLSYGCCEAAVYRRLRRWLVRRPPAPANLPFPQAVATAARSAA